MLVVLGLRLRVPGSALFLDCDSNLLTHNSSLPGRLIVRLRYCSITLVQLIFLWAQLTSNTACSTCAQAFHPAGVSVRFVTCLTNITIIASTMLCDICVGVIQHRRGMIDSSVPELLERCIFLDEKETEMYRSESDQEGVSRNQAMESGEVSMVHEKDDATKQGDRERLSNNEQEEGWFECLHHLTFSSLMESVASKCRICQPSWAKSSESEQESMRVSGIVTQVRKSTGLFKNRISLEHEYNGLTSTIIQRFTFFSSNYIVYINIWPRKCNAIFLLDPSQYFCT
jgi:hypothetical protein